MLEVESWPLSSPATLSVVIPAHNAADTLQRCLERLQRSTELPLECIVVDDGSTDDSAQIAAAFGATVLSAGTCQGPAAARNLGARHASGDIVFFLDADVCVALDTTARVRATFENDPTLDAMIGSYDDSPASKDFLSQYKNLMHAFVHQHGRSEASTFWSGCGAIRRAVFLRHSGFDQTYRRPAIEDIELGYRLRREGARIILDPHVQVTHLKKWTFLGLLKSDIFDRGIPWTELILRDRNMPNDLNLQLSQRVSVALSYMLLAFGAACAIQWRGYFLTPLFAMLLFLVGRYWLDAARPRSWPVAAGMTVLVTAIVMLAYYDHMLGLIPAVLLGFAVLFIRHRYASREMPRRWVRRVFGMVVAGCALFTLSFVPERPLTLGFFLVLMTIVILNNRFYIFLAAKRGRLFAVGAVPFHLLYHVYNGLSFGMGLCRYAALSILSRARQRIAM